MPQYINAFINNGYDRFDAIHEIEESDLKGIGVKAGHIKVILKAIRGLQQSQSGDTTQNVYANAPVSNAHPPSYGVVSPIDSNINAQMEGVSNTASHGAVNVEDKHYLSWSGPMALSATKGKVLGKVDIDKNFAVHLTFTVHGNIDNNYGNIFGISSNGGGKGSRTPLLF